MGDGQSNEVWDNGVAYEPYVGRWSRLVAREFLQWLSLPSAIDWLDVGCGTGALTQAILRDAAPKSVTGIDFSTGYIAYTREQTRDSRVSFEVGDAQALQWKTARFDAAVSGLVLNFVPNPDRAIGEMVRVTRDGGWVAAYVWDYAGKMELMRYFWDAAVALDPAAVELDEGRRFPVCQPSELEDLFENAGLQHVEVRAIDVPTHFQDFDDYWSPFLGGEAPAPGYAMSLSHARRNALCAQVRSMLPIAPDGTIPLIARAWAVRGRRA